MNILEILHQILKGGAGSGNWGHVGVLGKRGGSASNKLVMSLTSGKTVEERKKPIMRAKKIAQMKEDKEKFIAMLKDLQILRNELKSDYYDILESSLQHPENNKKSIFTMYEMDAKRLGREIVEERGGYGPKVVAVKMSEQEKDNLKKYTKLLDEKNELYTSKIQKIDTIKNYQNGKKMLSKYSGKSGISGKTFDAGTEIYYQNRTAVPVEEIEEMILNY